MTPRINKLLSFSSLAKKIEEVGIKDLDLIINAAFNNPKDSIDWVSIQKRMIEDDKSHEDSPFSLLSR